MPQRLPTSNRRPRLLAALLCGLWSSSLPAAPAAPATMLIEGAIAASSVVLPETGDAVLVFALDSGLPVGQGSMGRNNQFVAAATRPSSLNGSRIVFELQRGNRRFALIDAAEGYAGTRFQGQLLPERVQRSFRIGRQTAILKADEAADAQAQRLVRTADLPCTEETDLNHDGRCDAEDDAIAALYGGGIFRVVGRP